MKVGDFVCMTDAGIAWLASVAVELVRPYRARLETPVARVDAVNEAEMLLVFAVPERHPTVASMRLPAEMVRTYTIPYTGVPPAAFSVIPLGGSISSKDLAAALGGSDADVPGAGGLGTSMTSWTTPWAFQAAAMPQQRQNHVEQEPPLYINVCLGMLHQFLQARTRCITSQSRDGESWQGQENAANLLSLTETEQQLYNKANRHIMQWLDAEARIEMQLYDDDDDDDDMRETGIDDEED